jgi:hypothetical protein
MPSIINATTTNGVVASGDNSGALQLATNNGTTAVTIDTSQNVGIGATSPSVKLQATAGSSGSGVVNTLRLQNVGTTFGDGAKILFTAGASTDGAGIASTGVALNSADLRFYTGGNTEQMRIDSSGSMFVGGTTQNTATKPVYSSTTTKAWVNFNAQTNTIRNSFNVSSVTNNGSGNMQVNFTNAFANANYVPIAWGSNDGATRCIPQFDGTNSSTAGEITTGYLRYYNGSFGGATFTTQFQWLVCFSA